ncbi:beta-1,6-N-acetylglucosaminyltransferase [Fructilactobacillus sanfranciscensis]|uniref:beta-1,6-N-acetylglucosaminyltransferase n=1 Tax=Fructilactobacillus sanfranciscensis TaxID=1625 RepID=UPI0031F9939A
MFWGDYSQIEAEMFLFKQAAKNNYEYYHLISGADLPLVSQDKIHDFFDKNPNKEFLIIILDKNNDQKIADRVSIYHFFVKICGKNTKNIFLKTFFSIYPRLEKIAQKLFKVDRLKNSNIEIQYGSNWVTIDDEFIKYILSKEKWIEHTFKNTICPDEMFLPTLLVNSKYKNRLFYAKMTENKSSDEFQGNLRYINWWSGPQYPKVWGTEDYNELAQAKEKGYIFARKFDSSFDVNIINEVLKNDDIDNK